MAWEDYTVNPRFTFIFLTTTTEDQTMTEQEQYDQALIERVQDIRREDDQTGLEILFQQDKQRYTTIMQDNNRGRI